MANLLEIFRDTVGDQLAVQASSFLGESTENTASAINVILPAILGGFVQKGTTAKGVTAIFEFFKKESTDTSLLAAPGGQFGGGEATNQLIEKGLGVLEFLFGSDAAPIDKITNIVTTQSGIGLGSASTLMKMTAATLMSTIGSYIKNQSLDPVGLNRLLVSQKEIVKKAAPEGLFEKLGFSLSQDDLEDEEETKEVSTAPSTISKVVPWIFLISIAFGLFYFMRSCGGRDDTTIPSGEAVQEVTDSAETQPVEETVADTIQKTIADAESGATRSSEGGIVWIKFPDGGEIEIREGSFVDQFYKYLNGGPGDVNTRFTFDNLVFQTGSSNIAPSSMTQLQTLSSLMHAYPDVEIRIEGHTDNAGDPTANKLLSEQRALAVKFSLTELGVANDRIQTAGYGDEVPLESNETEAGRRMNRRVDVFVIKK